MFFGNKYSQGKYLLHTVSYLIQRHEGVTSQNCNWHMKSGLLLRQQVNNNIAAEHQMTSSSGTQEGVRKWHQCPAWTGETNDYR